MFLSEPFLRPRHFPDPHTFDPEHFSPEAKAARSPYLFQAFGQGPRNCVGMRFALMMMKVAMLHVVYHYRVVPGPSTPAQVEPDPMSQSAQPKGGSHVMVERRRRRRDA